MVDGTGACSIFIQCALCPDPFCPLERAVTFDWRFTLARISLRGSCQNFRDFNIFDRISLSVPFGYQLNFFSSGTVNIIIRETNPNESEWVFSLRLIHRNNICCCWFKLNKKMSSSTFRKSECHHLLAYPVSNLCKSINQSECNDFNWLGPAHERIGIDSRRLQSAHISR